MDKKPSWDDLSSLKLEMDDSKPGDDLVDDRGAGHLTSQDIINMLPGKIEVIQVKVATRNGTLPQKGVLQDLRQNSMSFTMPGHNFTIQETVLLETTLGEQQYKIEAKIKQQSAEQVEAEFIDPDEDYVRFFKDLLSTKGFNYRI